MPHKTALVVGGTSGLGLALARFLAVDHQVTAIGRRQMEDTESICFERVNLSWQRSRSMESYDENRLYEILARNCTWDTIVYAVGFYQYGRLGELKHTDIDKMIQIGLEIPIHMMNVMLTQLITPLPRPAIPRFIAITSTSQWVPREMEPVYTAVKAGLGMFANSLSMDPNVGKVLVAAPSGMKTDFWANTDKDTTHMMDPAWVATRIMELAADPFKYRFVKIHGRVLPGEIEVVETR